MPQKQAPKNRPFSPFFHVSTKSALSANSSGKNGPNCEKTRILQVLGFLIYVFFGELSHPISGTAGDSRFSSFFNNSARV